MLCYKDLKFSSTGILLSRKLLLASGLCLSPFLNYILMITLLQTQPIFGEHQFKREVFSEAITISCLQEPVSKLSWIKTEIRRASKGKYHKKLSKCIQLFICTTIPKVAVPISDDVWEKVYLIYWRKACAGSQRLSATSKNSHLSSQERNRDTGNVLQRAHENAGCKTSTWNWHPAIQILKSSANVWLVKVHSYNVSSR